MCHAVNVTSGSAAASAQLRFAGFGNTFTPGAATWPGSISALAKNGRVVTCGATSGYDARTDLRQVFYRHLNLLGSFMGSKAELIEALKFIARGQIRAVVDETLPLAEARRAHEQMQNRAQFGKLVLVP